MTTKLDPNDPLVPTYARGPVQFVRGQGTTLWSADGRPYLDFLAGIAVNGLGHAHERMVRELSEQLRTLVHISNLWAHPLQIEVATRLARATGLQRVFFTNSGTEAVEGALKFARKHQRERGAPGRTGFVAFEGSFHGRTFGSLSITWTAKYRAPFEPLLSGVTFVPLEDSHALEAALATKPAAVVLEPIQGEGGIREMSVRFLRDVRRLTKETDTVLIHDEVQSGCGRTGTFLAADAAGVKPDIVTLAKPIAGGIPMGAIVTTDAIAASIKPGEHGSTFAGGPLACRAAKVYLEELFEHGLMERAAEKGRKLKEGLVALSCDFPCIEEVRGRGLLLGLKLDRPGKEIAQAIFDKGLIINCTSDSVLRLAPPLVVTDEQIDQALSILADTLPRDRAPAPSSKT